METHFVLDLRIKEHDIQGHEISSLQVKMMCYILDEGGDGMFYISHQRGTCNNYS